MSKTDNDVALVFADPVSTDFLPDLMEKIDELFSVVDVEGKGVIVVKDTLNNFRKCAVQKITDIDSKNQGRITKADVFAYFKRKGQKEITALDIVHINETIEFVRQNRKNKIVKMRKRLFGRSSKNKV